METSLLWLGVLLLVGQLAGQSTEFQCKNGRSVKASFHCDGEDDCGDGSDEDPSECEANTFPVSVNQTVTVRVRHDQPKEGITFTLCDAGSCSKLAVFGSYSSGAVLNDTYVDCNKLGIRDCNAVALANQIAPGYTMFPPGQHVFAVQRRPQQLAVWLQGHPEHAVTVPVKDSYDRLRVRYEQWAKDSPRVEFSANPAAVGERGTSLAGQTPPSSTQQQPSVN